MTKKAKFAGRRDQNTETLPVYVPSVETLLRDTVLIRVTSKFERGTRALEFSDLGLEDIPDSIKEFASKYMRLGQAQLIDNRILRALVSLEQQLRNLLRKNGVPTPWGGYAVRKDRYEEVTTRLSQLIAEMDRLTDELVATRDAWAANLRQEFRSLGLLASGLRRGTEPDKLNQAARGREAEIESYLDSIMALVPTAQAIRDKYAVEWVAARVASPRIAIGLDEIQKLETEKKRLEAEIKALGASTEKEIARIQLEDVKQRLATERRIHEESEARVASLWEKEVAGVVREASAQVRDNIYTVITEVQEMVAKHGTMSKAQANKLEKLIAGVKAVTLGDDNMKTRMEEFEALLATVEFGHHVKEPPDISRINEVMADLAAQARSELFQLNRSPRRRVQIAESDDEPAVFMSRAAGKSRVAVAASAGEGKAPEAVVRRSGARRRPRNRTKTGVTA